jgi:DNA uptake protein ComE-like DNA-binding protein
MAPDSKPFLKWFGYSRRERRSTFILLIIIVLVILLRYIVPERNIIIEDVSSALGTFNETLSVNREIFIDTLKLFPFDPNIASVETLTSLGLSKKQAGTVKNYRDKGGRFRQPSDFSKIYGVDKNLSERLVPYIKIEKEKDSSSYSENGSAQSPMIDLNLCDSTLLDRLPGIGQVLSVRIIKYRNLLGGFSSCEQLKEVYGLTEEVFSRIADRVFADSSGITQIKINSAGFKDLIRHPYFERYDVQSILKYRELKGRINSLAELTDNKILTLEKANRIRPYLSFEK